MSNSLSAARAAAPEFAFGPRDASQHFLLLANRLANGVLPGCVTFNPPLQPDPAAS